MLLSENEVNREAWDMLLAGATLMVDQWTDSDGFFTEEDADRIKQRARELVDSLDRTVWMLLYG
jgi:hypothetical protein